MTYTLDQGWGVQLTSGLPTSAELELMESSAVTSFGAHRRVSDFPAPEELAARPRRMMHLAGADGAALYLHAVEAGTDSTGRPNNVYNHALFDRRADPSSQVRPIDFWRSPDLLVPWNHLEVAAAELGAAEQPRAGDTVGLDSVITFICDPSSWRAGVLSVLMDAIGAALEGGAPVVLIADDQDSAALWLGAVERLMAPSTAREISWSLYERASGLAAVWARGVHFAAVPRTDAGEIAASTSLVVIDEAEMPEIGQPGGAAHVTAAGSAVVASEWSAMAQMVLVDEAIARRALVTLDAVASRVGDTDLSVGWPLAMAVVLLGDETMDARESASRVLLDSSPEAIRGDAELFERTAHVVAAQIGSTTWGVWKEIAAREPDASRLVYELMSSAYLERSLADEEWLLRDEDVPLPRPLLLPDADRDRLRMLGAQAVTSLPDRLADREPGTGAVMVLRLLDLLVRSGLLSGRPADAGAVAEARSALSRSVIPLLQGEAGIAVATRTGAVDVRLREQLLLPLANEARSGAVLGPMPEEVLNWLCGGTAQLPQDLRARVAASIEPLPPFLLDLVLWHLREGEPAPGAVANAAYSLLLEAGDWGLIPLADRLVLERAMPQSDALRVPELAQLEDEFGGSVPDGYVEAQLASAPASAALDKFCWRVLDSRRGNRCASFAVVRLYCGGADIAGLGDEVVSPAALRAAVLQMAEVVGAGVIPAEVAARYLVLTTQVLGRGPYGPAWRAAEAARRAAAIFAEPMRGASAEDERFGLDENVGTPEPEVALIRDLAAAAVPAAKILRDGARGRGSERLIERLALLSFLTSPDFPDPTAVDARAHALAALRVPDDDGGSVRLVDDALRERVSAGAVEPDALAARVLERLSAVLAQRGGDRLLASIERSTKGWQRELRGSKSRGPLLGGFASFLSDRKER